MIGTIGLNAPTPEMEPKEIAVPVASAIAIDRNQRMEASDV